MSTSVKRHAAKQPALYLATAFGCGIVTARFLDAGPLACLVTCGALAAATLTFMLLRHEGVSTVLLLALVFAAGGYDAALASRPPADSVARVVADDGPAPEGAVLHFRGTVFGNLGRTKYGEKETFRFVLRASEIELGGSRLKVSGVALLDCSDQLPYGSEVEGTAFFRLPAAASNPGQFDYRKYLADNGMCCTARADAPGALRVTDQPMRYFFGRTFANVRRNLLDRMAALGLGNEGVIPAILLGDRSSIPDTTTDYFVRSGTMHLLSISGLHLVIVAGFFLWFLRFFGVSLRTSSIVTLAIACCYVLTVGLMPPVVRSAIMLGLFCFGIITDRLAPALSVVSTTALVMLVAGPLQLYDVGFQMSFVAVLGLFYLGVPLGRYLASLMAAVKLPFRGLVNETAQVFGISIGAGASVAPLGMYHFGVVSFVSPFANLLLIPTTSVMLIAGFAAAGLSFISMKIAGLAALSASGAETALVALACLFSKVPLAYAYVKAPFWLALTMNAYLVALGVAAAFGKRLGALFIAGLVGANALVWWGTIPSRNGPPEIVTLEDAHSAAVLAFDGKGHTALFVGRRCDTRAARDLICPFLLSRGVSSVDLMVETAGADARVRDVLAERFGVGKVVRQRKFMSSPSEAEAPHSESKDMVGGGDVLSGAGDFTIAFHAPPPVNFLAPAGPWYEGLVMDVTVSGRRALIAADATDRSIITVRDRTPERPDVLCVLNYSGKREILESWVSALKARTIVEMPSPQSVHRGSVSIVLADEPVVRRFEP